MKLHHVVFCLHHRNLERAADLWRDLGLTFAEIDLPDLEIQVLIDWNAGIELVAPVPGSGPSAAAFTTFLETRGEGVYSVVMAMDELGDAVAVADRYGAQVEYSQHRQYGSLTIDEMMLAPVHGMPITFLSTAEQS